MGSKRQNKSGKVAGSNETKSESTASVAKPDATKANDEAKAKEQSRVQAIAQALLAACACAQPSTFKVLWSQKRAGAWAIYLAACEVLGVDAKHWQVSAGALAAKILAHCGVGTKNDTGNALKGEVKGVKGLTGYTSGWVRLGYSPTNSKGYDSAKMHPQGESYGTKVAPRLGVAYKAIATFGQTYGLSQAQVTYANDKAKALANAEQITAK
jgi:hypothetical protein